MSAAQIVTRLIISAIQSETAHQIGRYAIRQATAAVVRYIQGSVPRRPRSTPHYS